MTDIVDDRPTLRDGAHGRHTIDVKIQTRDRQTEWLLRALEGKWLIEATGSRMMSARCDSKLDTVMKHALDYHDGMQDDDR